MKGNFLHKFTSLKNSSDIGGYNFPFTVTTVA